MASVKWQINRPPDTGLMEAIQALATDGLHGEDDGGETVTDPADREKRHDDVLTVPLA
jgi:hypothetical protein